MKSANSRVLLLVAGPGLIAGCTDGGSGFGADALEPWTLVSEARIGSVDDPEQSLTRVGPVMIAPNGDIYVAQPRDDQIRRYDATGRLVATIGRSGEGPGEFAALTSIGLAGDTLWASDQNLQRVSWFSPTGEYVRSKPWAAQTVRGDGRALFLAGAPTVLLDDSTAIVDPALGVAVGSTALEAGISGGSRGEPYFRVDDAAPSIDTVALVANTWSTLRLQAGDRFLSYTVPFATDQLAALMPDGSGVVVVDRALRDAAAPAFGVTLVGPQGDTVFVRSIPYAPVPVTDDVLRRAVEEAAARYESLPEAPPVSEIERALRDADVVPASLPPVTAVFGAQDGSIWLRREEASDTVIWNVLDRDGRPDGAVRLLPAQEVVAASGDVMIALELDSLDVPYLVRYRIRR